jgi:uncharacterized protein (UPF0335 family)
MTKEKTKTINNVAGTDLLSIIQRIEHLEDDIGGIQDDRKAVYAESKSRGFEPKIIRKIVQMRRRSKDELEEEESLLDIYKLALGMADTD